MQRLKAARSDVERAGKLTVGMVAEMFDDSPAVRVSLAAAEAAAAVAAATKESGCW